MGLKVTLLDPETRNATAVLCDSPEALPTMGIRLGFRQVMTISDLLEAAYAVAIDTGPNRRTQLSFNVTRQRDEANTPFPGPASALKFALLEPNKYPGLQIARLDITDERDQITLFMLNCFVAEAPLNQFNGVRLVLGYTLNAGEIVTQLPAPS
jgi:hypothetical protein